MEWIFLLATIVQGYFYFRYFLPLAIYREVEAEDFEGGISVIIAAKNEEKNLQKYLPAILEQDFPNFEVVLVDDGSKDGTNAYLSSITSDKFRFIRLEESIGKKAALQQAIEAAKSEYLVFTDADCKPSSPHWLKEMSKPFSNDSQVEIVLGYGRFFAEGGLWNKLLRFEDLISAMQYFSFAIIGHAYMGVGRNLAYTKSVYHRSSAFQKHSDRLGGDDDLLVNEQASPNNVGIAIKPTAHTFSHAEASWLRNFHQKRRQLQVGEDYKREDRLRLMFFGLSNFAFYFSFFWLLYTDEMHATLWTILGLKLVVQITIFQKIMAKLGDKDLLFWIPILEIFYLLQSIVIGTSTWIWKVKRWK